MFLYKHQALPLQYLDAEEKRRASYGRTKCYPGGLSYCKKISNGKRTLPIIKRLSTTRSIPFYIDGNVGIDVSLFRISAADERRQSHN